MLILICRRASRVASAAAHMAQVIHRLAILASAVATDRSAWSRGRDRPAEWLQQVMDATYTRHAADRLLYRANLRASFEIAAQGQRFLPQRAR